MRRPAAGILAALVLIGALGAVSPAAAAAPLNPKVVLVVGATHGTTPQYRAWMNEVYTVARRYTSNVIKVYSPNATWSAVRKAAQGANILVYMGHGNGFPSPYRTSPYPQSQNGFGLNATAGAGDSNTTYYGEYYVGREIDLAPNAVVILSHLCYASGNSEPGKTAPTLSQARQRIDNFAAGFLAAGARAVIADGHMDPGWYVDQLFTTHKTVEQVFRDHPAGQGTVYSFNSSRTPGFKAFYDPDHDNPVSGFYRSMVAIPGLRTDDVTGAAAAPTDGTPSSFVIPGAAQVVAVGGAGLWSDPDLTNDPATGLPPAQLPAGTRLRLAAEDVNQAGERTFAAQVLGSDQAGWVRAVDLAPRDSSPPRIGRFAVAPGVLSPVVSGSHATVSAAATEVVAWTMTVTDAAATVRAHVTASGREILATWDGRSGGTALPDGTYAVTLTAADSWGNAQATATGHVRLDATAPELTGVSAQGTGPATFSPNGDGTAESVRVAYSLSEAASLRMVVRTGVGTAVRTTTASAVAGAGSVSWDGRTDAGAFVADGDYTVELVPTDAAGNRGAAETAPVRVYTPLRAVALATPVFYPSDHDQYALTIRLPFVLDTAATVTWQIVDGAGVPVRTIRDAEALVPGSYSFSWDGRTDAGVAAPRGTYRSVVTATDGSATARIAASVTLDAFRIVASDATPALHQSVTYTATSAEPLAASPSLLVTEPGRGTVAYRMTRLGPGVYRATVRLAGSRTGSLSVRVNGRDARGGSNWTRVSFPLH